MNKFNSDFLHLWYAFSKDFSMSGFRFGVVHSLNKSFLMGIGNANLPHMVSNITQWLVGELVFNTEFVASYIGENQNRITKSYKLVINRLKELEVPYYPSRGSFFVWADFSKYLKEDSENGEENLWLEIFRNSGVLLTPGKGFEHEKKGLFRIVFTAIPFSHLQVAMDRMVGYLVKRKT